MSVKHSVLNVKTLVGAFNQEKALLGKDNRMGHFRFNVNIFFQLRLKKVVVAAR